MESLLSVRRTIQQNIKNTTAANRNGQALFSQVKVTKTIGHTYVYR